MWSHANIKHLLLQAQLQEKISHKKVFIRSRIRTNTFRIYILLCSSPQAQAVRTTNTCAGLVTPTKWMPVHGSMKIVEFHNYTESCSENKEKMLHTVKIWAKSYESFLLSRTLSVVQMTLINSSWSRAHYVAKRFNVILSSPLKKITENCSKT